MAINRVLCVRYTDDGCNEYKCLSCYCGWECRSCGMSYCGYCGIEWNGEEENQREKRQERYYQAKRERDYNRDVIDYPTSLFIIESRFIFSSGSIGTWTQDYSYDVRCGGQMALEKLNELRREELFKDKDDDTGFGCRIEHRLRGVKYDRHEHGIGGSSGGNYYFKPMYRGE